MNGQPSPEDRPDPRESAPALRARVTDAVAPGIFSSGVIVMTGPTEFVLDFVQNLTRPHRVAARVVLPHPVMGQFVDALRTNLGLYEKRFGKPHQPPGVQASSAGTSQVQISPGSASPAPGVENPAGPGAQGGDPAVAGGGATGHPPAGGGGGAAGGQPQRPAPSPQEVYDDLKLPDELLSGVYANGVMIGHGASEFCLDFLTSFFPQSAVSARVYIAAGQVPRLIDSMANAFSQLQQRAARPPGHKPPSPGPPGPESPEEPPDGGGEHPSS